jgi:hypothetical protein
MKLPVKSIAQRSAKAGRISALHQDVGFAGCYIILFEKE